MQLTVDQVIAAVQTLDTIIRDKRPMPQLAKYRLARMHSKLLPEFVAAAAQRDELIVKHGDRRDDGQTQVPPCRMAAFNAEWAPIGAVEVDVDIEPVRLADMALGKPEDPANGALETSELIMLGALVTE